MLRRNLPIRIADKLGTALFSQLSTIHRHVLKNEAEREYFRKVWPIYICKIKSVGLCQQNR